MWDASDVDCRMRFIRANHDVGIRCRGSVRQAVSILRSYLPLVDGIVARQIVIVAIIVWVENHDTPFSIVEMAMETIAGSGYETSATRVRTKSRSVLKMTPGCLRACFRCRDREYRQKHRRQNLHKLAFKKTIKLNLCPAGRGANSREMHPRSHRRNR